MSNITQTIAVSKFVSFLEARNSLSTSFFFFFCLSLHHTLFCSNHAKMGSARKLMTVKISLATETQKSWRVSCIHMCELNVSVLTYNRNLVLPLQQHSCRLKRILTDIVLIWLTLSRCMSIIISVLDTT